MKIIVGLAMIIAIISPAMGQVDTAYVYRTGMPYGTLDIRIAKSSSRFYYLQENKTFSFRESSPGVKTDTYVDMTSWDSSPYMQGNLREKNGTSDYFIMNYRLLPPNGYNPSYPDGYPLILMVHGLGERGNCWDGGCYWADKSWRPQTNTPPAPTTSNHQLLNNDHNLLHGGKAHLDARNLAGTRLPNDPTLPARAFPGFVLFPQNLNGWDANSVQDVIRLVRLVSKRYNIDQDRIYVHGLSNGGYATYEVIKRAPWLFASALPMSAVNDANITYPTYSSVLNDVSHIPLWIFQGGIDTNPVPSKTRTYVKKFRDAGMTVRYKEYANLGHGVWNDAYNEPDFFSWMLSQNKSQIHTFGDVAAICLSNGEGVRMTLASGFRKYEWQLNGVTIADATSSTYTAMVPGIYRARFSRVENPTEGDWNQWSDPVTVTESNPAQAQLIQHGTVHLKDLNNYNDAKLSAVGEFAHYYWYKDGVLLDLPGNQDDTTQHPIFKQGTCTNLPACTGNGSYTLVTSGYDNCPSPASEPKQIFFNHQAPININAPGSFTGNASSHSAANLHWTDLSTNEDGFEIWRRKRLSATSFSIWSMATLTAANQTSFTDEGLEPLSTYQYKIRAIGSTGRSNYTPSASNQFLTVTTGEDSTPPGVPQNVTASATAIRTITVSWEASSDDSGIRKYLVFFNSDTVETSSGSMTSVVIDNLEINTTYEFTVKAMDLGGNFSAASTPATANTYTTGLYYQHSTGSWSDLDQVDWSIAEYEGTVANFTLTPRKQEDYFNFQFEGYLSINVAGTYQFRTISDDGSRLTLNNTVIVDNDGLHGNVTVTSANQTLQSGPHLINVKYFENSGGQSLTVQYRGPDSGNNWVTIPDNVLRSGTPRAETPPSENPVEDLDELTAEMINYFPNPLDKEEQLNLQVIAPDDRHKVHIKLQNIIGESYYNKVYDPSELRDPVELTTKKKLRKGIYILTVRQRGNEIKQRVIVKD